MIHITLTRFLYFILFSCSNILHVPALCDIIIKHESLKQIAFAAGSDFVQTGCGSFFKPAYLIISDPFDACKIPKEPPPSHEGLADNHQWILLALGNSSATKCDFKTKFRNTADAGYSAIIIGTENFHEEIIFPGLMIDDDEEFIDVHLINPADIKILSKYAYPKPFVVIPPVRHRCKDEYRKSWIRSRFGSRMLRYWKDIKRGILASFTHSTNLIRRALTRHIRILLKQASDSSEILLYWGCVVVVPVTPVLLVYVFLFSERYSHNLSPHEEDPNKQPKHNAFTSNDQTNTFTKQDEEQKCSSSFNEGNKDRKNEYSNTNEDQQGHDKTFKNNSYHRKEQPIPPRSRQLSVDYTLYHRINLGIKLSAVLTKAEVSSAYRKFALKYHPDKHRHLDVKQMDKITEEFRSKTKSRDILLTFCKE